MSYEYTDCDDARLRVEAFRGSRVGEQVHITTSRDGAYVRPEDAPAVALAILEAAGLAPYEVGCTADRYFAHEAVDKLRDAVQFRKDQAERDAEDAKVRAWWDETRYGHTTALAWGHMGESAHEDVRKQYHLARKFFEEQS